MASEFYTPQESSLTIDEFEMLEDIEFDPNTLSELFYELNQEVENIEAPKIANTNSGIHDKGFWHLDEEEVELDGDLKQSKMVAGTVSEYSGVGYRCLDNFEANFPNLNWIDMVEDISPPYNEVEAWYEGIGMEEMFEMGYSFSDNATVCDEIGYVGLWQEN